MHKSVAPGRSDSGVFFLPVAPNMEPTLRHPSGPHNFAVGLRFLENVCTPRIENLEFHIYFFIKVALILIQGSLGKKVLIFFYFLIRN
jgi:hypothetical protein